METLQSSICDEEEDFQDRVDMCKTLTSMLEDNDIKESFFFFDETTFYLQDLVNKHNIRYRCEINPRITIESIMKSPKV